MNCYNVNVSVFQLVVSTCRVRYSEGFSREASACLLKVGTSAPMTTPSSPLFTASLVMAAGVILKDALLRGLVDVSVMVKCPYGERSMERLSEILSDMKSKINFHIFNENS